MSATLHNPPQNDNLSEDSGEGQPKPISPDGTSKALIKVANSHLDKSNSYLRKCKICLAKGQLHYEKAEALLEQAQVYLEKEDVYFEEEEARLKSILLRKANVADADTPIGKSQLSFRS